MTFAEVVVAMQDRLGHRVKVTLEQHGRIRRTHEGVLTPGVPGATEAIPDEDGRVGFSVAAHTFGFLLDPSLVTGAREQPDQRRLRVEMVDGAVFVIETLAPAG